MELMAMEDSEVIADYFTRVLTLVNKMKQYGETIKDQVIVEKILRTLPSRFEHIVCAIEESKNLEELKVEELQGSLESHEQRMLEKKHDKPAYQALQAQSHKGNGGYDNKKKKGKGKWKNDKGKKNDWHSGNQRSESSNSRQDQKYDNRKG